MPDHRLLSMLLYLLLLCGCSWHVYELEMAPTGHQLERLLTCYKHEDNRKGSGLGTFPKVELERMAKAYGQAAPAPAARKYEFRGTFGEKTPNDIGGAGYFERLESPMGTLTAYVERFRGNDDIASRIERVTRSIDEYVAMVSRRLMDKSGPESRWQDVHRFVCGELRRDLKNMALYAVLWSDHRSIMMTPPGEEDRLYAHLLVRVLLYLTEHGYVSPRDLPRLRRMAEERPDRKDRERVAQVIREMLSRKLSRPKDDESVVVLADMLVGFPEFLGDEVLDIDIFEEPHRIKVGLGCPRRPFATNGEWLGLADGVKWHTVLPSGKDLPVVAYAVWTEPDTAFQTTHFGKVLLQHEKLAEYVLWYNGLTPREAKEWDALLGGLSPSVDLGGKIGAFLFDGERELGVAEKKLRAMSQAKTARELLLRALCRTDAL